MIERIVRIENKLGLHARPASLFVKNASRFESDIKLIKDGIEVNGKSIMGVMMLAAEMGSEITIKIDGADEEKAMKTLVKLVKVEKFDEE